MRACPKGHVDDLDWYEFVQCGREKCLGQLWLDETGATGELSNLRVRCSCGASRSMTEANELSANPPPLGYCSGARPWLGPNANEDCQQPQPSANPDRDERLLPAARPRPIDSRQGGRDRPRRR